MRAFVCVPRTALDLSFCLSAACSFHRHLLAVCGRPFPRFLSPPPPLFPHLSLASDRVHCSAMAFAMKRSPSPGSPPSRMVFATRHASSMPKAGCSAR